MPSGRRLSWCAVVTHAQAERRAAAAIHRYGFESYLPLITVRWADRTWHTQPLFRRYVFVRLHLDRPWSPVVSAPGVFQLVTFDGTKPATCSDAVVEAIQAGEKQRMLAATAASSRLGAGSACHVAEGAFAGHDAVILTVRHDRALIAMMCFNALREVAVQLDCLVPRD